MLNFDGGTVTWEFTVDCDFRDRHLEGIWLNNFVMRMGSKLDLHYMRDYDYEVYFDVEHYHPCCKHCGEPILEITKEMETMTLKFRFKEEAWNKFFGSECYYMCKEKGITQSELQMEFEDGVKMEVVLE